MQLPNASLPTVYATLDGFEDRDARRTGFQPAAVELVVTGLCVRCQASQ